MKLRVYYVFILSIYLLISCAVNPHVIMPDYQTDNIKDKELLITPIANSDIKVVDEIKEAFGEGNPESIYLPFFQEKFESILTKVSSFSKIYTNPLKEPNQLRAMEFIVPKNDTTYFYLPSEGEKVIDINGNIADYVLFISKLEVINSWIDIKYGNVPNIKHIIHYS